MLFFKRETHAGMSPQEAVDGAKDGSVTLIDVRDLGEVQMSGKAKGALHIPLMRVKDMADPRNPDFCADLKRDGKIAVYCASGARSNMAASALRKMGYEDVYNIGGFGHWVQAGGSVEKL
ncbi:rhodanese-like domain-containing protein [Phaeobacter marinintestinus]|uniref:rhodanese-like domain-containing protein n=1 Tax=Falsiphaeobacter marinintestinus TaxID=1492905 RepID=UPI0011B6DE1B|nr:rhodanese-like domain-containing protein [Phaeobacter marinintestinus]